MASNTTDKRFRNLSILKGFGVSQNIQYINKDMMYNHSKDNHLGMGLIELSFKLDHNNKVRCVTRKLHPFDVIKGIGAKGKVSSTADPTDPLNIDKMSHWIKMQDCIDYLHETGDQNCVAYWFVARDTATAAAGDYETYCDLLTNQVLFVRLAVSWRSEP